MYFACQLCGQKYDGCPEMCTVCFSGSFWPVPEAGKVAWTRKGRKGVRSAREIKPIHGAKLAYPEIGKLPKKWKMIVFGPPGGGKSTFSMIIADRFVRSLYVAHEEGDETISGRVQRLEIVNLSVSDAGSVSEIEMDANETNAEIIILDSLTSLDFGMREFSMVSEMTQRVIGVCQIRKDGNFAGPMELMHFCDIGIRVDQMSATTVKNRFADLTTFPILTHGPQSVQ